MKDWPPKPGNTDAQAEAAHLGEEGGGVRHFDVDRAAVGPGLGERLEEVAWVGHHEVAVEEEPRVAPE
jgi:hypothetical protein